MAVAFPVEPTIPSVSELTNQNCLSIAEARKAIKAKFCSYRRLLDKKELELLSELDTIEETNKPELSHVRYDLKKLRVAITTLDESLETNTLKAFLEQQKSVWNSEIKEFERCERLLSHLRLKYSDFNLSVENIIEIVPFRTKAKFRSDLAPLLELELKVGDEWFLVADSWFSTFTAAINLASPQNDDSWRFPESIPIDHLGIYVNGQIRTQSAFKGLHSKAWSMLLGYHNLSPGSHPIKRLPFLNPLSKKVTLPIVPITHKCHIGHRSGGNDFNIKIDLICFPTDTYAEVLNKVSNFCSLITSHTPQFFCYANYYSVTYSASDAKYRVTVPSVPNTSNRSYTFSSYGSGGYGGSPDRVLTPLRDLSSQIGLSVQTFLLLIPDSSGTIGMQVVSNVPALAD